MTAAHLQILLALFAYHSAEINIEERQVAILASLPNVYSLIEDGNDPGTLIAGCFGGITKINKVTGETRLWMGSLTSSGFTDGVETMARMTFIKSIIIVQSQYLVADSDNSCLRAIVANIFPSVWQMLRLVGNCTFPGYRDGIVINSVQFNKPRSLVLLNSSAVIIAEEGSSRLRVLSLIHGVIPTSVTTLEYRFGGSPVNDLAVLNGVLFVSTDTTVWREETVIKTNITDPYHVQSYEDRNRIMSSISTFGSDTLLIVDQSMCEVIEFNIVSEDTSFLKVSAQSGPNQETDCSVSFPFGILGRKDALYLFVLNTGVYKLPIGREATFRDINHAQYSNGNVNNTRGSKTSCSSCPCHSHNILKRLICPFEMCGYFCTANPDCVAFSYFPSKNECNLHSFVVNIHEIESDSHYICYGRT